MSGRNAGHGRAPAAHNLKPLPPPTETRTTGTRGFIRPRIVVSLVAAMLVLGLGDCSDNWKVLPASWMRLVWTQNAHAAAAPTVRTFELAFARAYNKTATAQHGQYRVAAIACATWKAGVDSCDVVFARKPGGQLLCAVLAVETPSGSVVAGRRVKCPGAGVAAAKDTGPKA